jgi:hypothetical protein
VFDEGVRLDCKILRPDSVYLLLVQLKAGQQGLTWAARSNVGSKVYNVGSNYNVGSVAWQKFQILTNFCAPPIAPPTGNHGLRTGHNQRCYKQMELTGGFSVRHWYRNHLPRNSNCSGKWSGIRMTEGPLGRTGSHDDVTGAGPT